MKYGEGQSQFKHIDEKIYMRIEHTKISPFFLYIYYRFASIYIYTTPNLRGQFINNAYTQQKLIIIDDDHNHHHHRLLF